MKQSLGIIRLSVTRSGSRLNSRADLQTKPLSLTAFLLVVWFVSLNAFLDALVLWVWVMAWLNLEAMSYGVLCLRMLCRVMES